MQEVSTLLTLFASDCGIFRDQKQFQALGPNIYPTTPRISDGEIIAKQGKVRLCLFRRRI